MANFFNYYDRSIAQTDSVLAWLVVVSSPSGIKSEESEPPGVILYLIDPYHLLFPYHTGSPEELPSCKLTEFPVVIIQSMYTTSRHELRHARPGTLQQTTAFSKGKWLQPERKKSGDRQTMSKHLSTDRRLCKDVVQKDAQKSIWSILGCTPGYQNIVFKETRLSYESVFPGAKFVDPDWGIQLTAAQGCRSGLPAYVAWRAGASSSRQPCAGVNFIPPPSVTMNLANALTGCVQLI